MPSSTSDKPVDPERDWALGVEPSDGPFDAWKEPGSDELMDFDTLVRVRMESNLVDAARERRIERRAE